jgi:hypothetical protein
MEENIESPKIFYFSNLINYSIGICPNYQDTTVANYTQGSCTLLVHFVICVCTH